LNVAESRHANSKYRENLGTLSILSASLIGEVLATVQLDGEGTSRTEEIDDVLIDPVLAPELLAELVAAKVSPEKAFSIRRAAA
jgi:hypothetical protein